MHNVLNPLTFKITDGQGENAEEKYYLDIFSFECTPVNETNTGYLLQASKEIAELIFSE